MHGVCKQRDTKIFLWWYQGTKIREYIFVILSSVYTKNKKIFILRGDFNDLSYI